MIIVSGDRSSGKSTCAIRLAHTIAKLRGQKFSVKDDIYYTDFSNFDKEILTKKGLIKIIDETYFSAMNLDSNTSGVKTLVQALSAARSRQHCIILNVIKLTRVAKPILEIANYWMAKPSIDYGILYIRNREWISDDAWSIDELLKAKTVSKKRYLLTHNPNFITTMKTRDIPTSVFEEYKTYKAESQRLKGLAGEMVVETKEREAFMLNTWYQMFTQNPPVFQLENMKAWLINSQNMPNLFADRWVNKFRNFVVNKRMAEQMRLSLNPENNGE